MLFLRRITGWAYLTAILGAGLVLTVDAVVHGSLQAFFGTMSFILVVLAAASLGGWKPGLLATLLSLVGYIFFFVEPYYSLRVSNLLDLVMLSAFLVIGATISLLSEGLHASGSRLQERQLRLEQEILEHRKAEVALRTAEQKSREESARSSEAASLLRVTLASIGDGVITTDAESRVTFINAVAEALTGWSLAEARNRPVAEIFRIVNERTRATVENPCMTVLANGLVVGLANHTVLIARDGKETPIDDSAAPICDESGALFGAVLVFRDATRERTATATLQQLAAIVEHSNDAVIGKSLEGIITTWNAAAERLYRFTAQEAIGRPISIIVPPDRRSELAHIMERIRRGEPIAQMETVRLRKDGSRVDVSLAISLIKDSYGEVIGASKIARDISETKRARETVERNEKQLSDFFENSPVAMHWVGPDGAILRANQAELDLLGYSKEEYVGRQIAEFYVDARDIENIQDLLARRETIRSYETRLRCKDGSIKHVLIDANVYSTNEEFVHSRCFTRDITDRKQAEESLRLLVDVSESLASLIDVKSSMQVLARRSVRSFADWCAVHVATENDELRPIAHAHAEMAEDALIHAYLQRYPFVWNSQSLHFQALRNGRSSLAGDLTLPQFAPDVRDEGHHELLDKLKVRSLIVVPLVDRGKVIGTLTFARSDAKSPFTQEDLQVGEDLAKRAATAIENYRMYDELKVADRQKDDFLAMLAHELRNPLAAISYAGQLLRISPENTQSAVDIVGRQVRQLSHLINDLLDVSRITRGMIQLKKENVDAQTLVDRALETTRPLLEQQAHAMTREVSPAEMPLYVDATRVEQVLVNLITNAAKYTPKGGRVTISAFPENNQVVIRVKDAGIGIPAGMLPRVFDMFTQVDPSIDRAQGGLGIGLTVVRRLVEMHEGVVSAFSEGPGSGSEFTIRLPMGRSRVRDMSLQKEPAGPRADLRVLVVDDNVDTAVSVSILLKSAGCITETAHDGPSALDLAQSFRPDVALLDIGLPGLDGFEVAKRIRANGDLNHVKLIAISGYGRDQDRTRAKDAGFDHHLVKPVQFATLTALLAD